MTIVDDDAIVLNRTPAQIDAALVDLQALGVDWLRVNAQWSRIAPAADALTRPTFDARDPAAYPPHAWDRLDLAVRSAAAHGLRAMIDVGFWAPRWATTDTVAPPERQRFDIHAAEFGEFAEAVARRYSGRYFGLPAAVGFTLWNEPNYSVFLLPQQRREGSGWTPASPDVYRAMIYAAYPAIKRVSPGAIVLIGATAATGSSRPHSASSGVPPLEFLRRLACVSDSLQPLSTPACEDFRSLPGDGWAHHPYSGDRPPDESDPDPDSATLADLGRLTGLLSRLHDAGRTQRALDVFVTEYGYQTDPPDPTQPWTPADQARLLPEAERLAYSHPTVRSFAQFLLRDLPERGGTTVRERWSDFQSGLRFPGGTLKPAWTAFRLPLVIEAGSGSELHFWGRVRPGSGPRLARIVQRQAGAWRPAAGLPTALRTDDRGVLSVSGQADPTATYRLEARLGGAWRAGAPTTVAGRLAEVPPPPE